MIAVQAQIIWGANLIPSGAACGGDDPRRRPTCSRMPANCVMKGSDDGTLATPGAGALGVAASMCGRGPIREFKQKARDGFLRAGFCNFRDDGVMPVICPTCQTVFEWSTNSGKFDETVSTN
ncbi:hypothetical protein IVB22_04205 [Bradyrhizobium sp. 190]|uniref:hypothetical protein n=1 Tax=Bradyrhizobium sp. 190 TaxID=2782658 RepID=UPI001FF840BD|nr:hypothetical protein [Bradyrhizobium sp. 190]MCK1511776.1 hypothetical protein [Bradyrhizobium sp. 190]